jgi:curved DNA-binding protein CbpA
MTEFSAPTRFRVLARAWQVLGDPARRAAYDRGLARERPPAARVTVRPAAGPGRVTHLAGMAGPPPVAGPVRVEGPRPAPPAAGWGEQDIRLAVLAELALRYLAAGRGRRW